MTSSSRPTRTLLEPIDVLWDGALAISSAIHPQNLSRHPATVSPAKESHGIRKLVRFAEPVKWTLGRDKFQQLLAFALVEEFRARGPRGDGVDSDTFASEVLGHDAVHLLDCTFGGVVQEVVRENGAVDA